MWGRKVAIVVIDCCGSQPLARASAGIDVWHLLQQEQVRMLQNLTQLEPADH